MNDRVASGWAAFAGVVLLIVGSLNVIYGLAAILNDEVIVAGGHGALIVDITFWGWVTLIIGVIMIFTGLGLFTGSAGARVMAVIFVSINAVAQMGLITAHPLWSILIVSLDVLILYNLIVKGGVTDVTARDR